MAQRIEILLVDDIDGSKADENIQFGLDGVEYEIDLSNKNAEKLRSSLQQFVESARRLKTGKRNATAAVGKRSGNTKEIRAWAEENGYQVSSRGRIQAEIVEAFESAHQVTG
jgi:Lsr2